MSPFDSIVQPSSVLFRYSARSAADSSQDGKSSTLAQVASEVTSGLPGDDIMRSTRRPPDCRILFSAELQSLHQMYDNSLKSEHFAALGSCRHLDASRLSLRQLARDRSLNERISNSPRHSPSNDGISIHCQLQAA